MTLDRTVALNTNRNAPALMVSQIFIAPSINTASRTDSDELHASPPIYKLPLLYQSRASKRQQSWHNTINHNELEARALIHLTKPRRRRRGRA